MLRNLTTGETLAQQVHRCDTFWKRGRGLMFRRQPARDEVYLFVERWESVVTSAITMFLVFFPIAVIWLDRDQRVVDKVLAQPFRPSYAPQSPAMYYIEGHPSLLECVSLDDQLEFA
jgi:uncharacterized membrane protein (UPF0127 family)